jgi:hypothetical protein
VPRKVPQPRDFTPDPNLIFYGCEAHVPAHDVAAMGRQDATGLWEPGRQRANAHCPTCNGTVPPNGHCGPCARTGDRFRGPEVITTAPKKEFLRPTVAGPQDGPALTPGAHLTKMLGRKPTKRELRRYKARIASGGRS